MRDKQCEVIRRELEEAALNEQFSGKAAEHMQKCSGCREFQRQQMKLRQIVGSLGTVDAPADFDFRLRARLAADSDRASVRFWSFAVRGLATVAVLVVFGVGAVMVWQRSQEVEPTVANAPQQETQQPQQPETTRREEEVQAGRHSETRVVANNTTSRRNLFRPVVKKQRQPIATRDISSVRASVTHLAQPALATTATVFPIEASLQAVKVSLDDGRGNARTISIPTVSFGSQRVPATANQLAQTGVW